MRKDKDLQVSINIYLPLPFMSVTSTVSNDCFLSTMVYQITAILLNLLIFCQESLECCQSPVLARWGILPQLGVTVQGELLQSNY